jgi:hypothetical protein
VLGRGLLKEFPNPERTGCPNAELLKGIASHKVSLAQAEPWLEHLTSCSPCYRDFSRFRESYRRRRNRILLATAAAILVAASISGWALLHKQNENLSAQTVVFDLRNRSLPRGAERNPNEQPLELGRRASKLTILLPLGSSEGFYEARIVTLSGESLVASSGTGKLKDGVTSLELALGLASLRPGTYLLQIRRPGSEWESYPLAVR